MPREFFLGSTQLLKSEVSAFIAKGLPHQSLICKRMTDLQVMKQEYGWDQMLTSDVNDLTKFKSASRPYPPQHHSIHHKMGYRCMCYIGMCSLDNKMTNILSW